MGLDIVEFVIGVEDSTGVRIPDDVAATIKTPRMLIDFLHSQLPPSPRRRCLSQRAFYRIRRALADRLGLDRQALRPGVEILSIIPVANAQTVWANVGDSLQIPHWPRAGGASWLARAFLSSRPRTLGDAARQLVAFSAALLKPAGEGWSWSEVAAVVKEQLRYQFEICDYVLDDRFVEDLGLG